MATRSRRAAAAFGRESGTVPPRAARRDRSSHSDRNPGDANAQQMKIITPRDFRNAFVAVMQAERDSFRTAVSFEAKSYAYFMRSNIFPKIARNLGLQAWNKEYYTL